MTQDFNINSSGLFNLKKLFRASTKNKNLNKFLNGLSNSDKKDLITYVYNKQGINDLTAVSEYLVENHKELTGLLVEAKAWCSNNENTSKTLPNVIPQSKVSKELDMTEKEPNMGRNIVLNLQSVDNVEPSIVLVISRDVSSTDRYTLQEINVDSGDYIPVDPLFVAQMLREYADNIEARQREINSND